MDKQKLKRNIPLTYLFEFGKNMGFTQAIWVTYLATKGLSLVEIGLCESVFHITSMLMELPTGMIADLYGRKISRLIGVIANLIYLTLLFFVDGLPMALLAFVFCALSYNLESGADTALVYDSLLALNQQDTFTRISGKREIILQSASLIGVAVGGVLADQDYRYAILGSILLGVAVFLVGLRFFEAPYPREKAEMRTMFANQFMKPWKMVKKQPDLVFHMVLVAVVLSSVTTTHYYLTVHLKNIGYSLSMIGLLLLLQAVGAILGGYFADRLKRRFDEALLFRLFPWGIVFAIALAPTPFFPISLMMLGFSDSVLYVVLTNRVNRNIQSDERATILSLNSMFFSIVMIALFPIFGVFADQNGLPMAFFGLAILTGLVALANGLKIRYRR